MISQYRLSLFFCGLLSLFSSARAELVVPNQDKVDLSVWMDQFKARALQEGVPEKIVESTLGQTVLLPKIIQLDRAQPEFITTFLDYLNKRVTPQMVSRGRVLLLEHASLLQEMEQRYAVPKEVLVAFWGMETNYGRMQGGFDLPSALMTLAYEGRRAEFFQRQLVQLMHIIAKENYAPKQLRGSWAGAMGHMQFMPTTLISYAVDADQDGQINLWQSLPDAFASAANYLTRIGWRKHEPVMTQIALPAGFDYGQAHLKVRKSAAEWSQMGVVIPSEWLGLENAAILLPQGWQGPAIMVFSNFDAVMDWNRSVNYALSVAYLSQQYQQEHPLRIAEGFEQEALSLNQMATLQTKLNTLGYDCGPPDGFPGLKTQEAIRAYQAATQLPQDGYASPSLYYQIIGH